MASTKLNIAIAALVAEAQLSTVEKLFAFLGEKIEIDDDMKGYFEEFKATLKVDQEVEAKAAKSNNKKGKKAEDGEEKKPKRAPSAYNLYIRDKMAEFKAAGHSGNLMKMAIEAWNADKAATKESSSSDAEETPAVEEPAADEPPKGAKAKRGPKAETKKKEPKTKKETKATKEEEAATEESDKDYE